MRKYISQIILTLTCFIIFFALIPFLSKYPQPNWDLFGHIAAIKLITFDDIFNLFRSYDPQTMGGWPTHILYGFIPHYIIWFSSFLLTPFSDDPITHATYLTAILTSALLPFAFYYAMNKASILADFDLDYKNKLTTALLASFFSLWWLNYAESFWGIGAAAVLRLGLLSQSYGVLLLIYFLGVLFDFIKEESAWKFQKLVILASLMALSNGIVYTYAIFIFGFTGLFYLRMFWKMFFGSILSLGLAGIWTVPMIAWKNSYGQNAVYVIYVNVVRLIFESHLAGIVITVLTLLFLTRRKLRRFSLMLAIGVFLFNFEYLFKLFSLEQHNYRFYCYLILTLIVLLPIGVISRFKYQKLIIGALGLLVLAQAFLAFRTRYVAFGPETFADENKVAEYFAGRSGVGRVWVEHSVTLHQNNSPHYLYSKLIGDRTADTLNSVFSQASVTSMFYTDVLASLGFSVYQVKNNYMHLYPKLSHRQLFDRLVSFGVTHIVSLNRELATKYHAELKFPLQSFKDHHVLEISSQTPQLMRAENRQLVGFLDLKGNFDINALQYWFFADQSAYECCNPLKLEPGAKVNSEFIVIVNGEVSGEKGEKGLPLIFDDDSPPKVIVMNYQERESASSAKFNTRLKHFVRATEFLNANIDLKKTLLSLAKKNASISQAPTIKARKNIFELDSLAPHPYSIDYAYFPLLSAAGAELYRGGQNQMVIAPTGERVEITFSHWTNSVIWAGIFVSLLSFLLLISSKSLFAFEAQT